MTSLQRIGLPLLLVLAGRGAAYAQDIPADVTANAGAGDLSYADAGVFELGGNLAVTRASKTTTVRIAPSIGYFVIDRVELTLFPELNVIHLDGNTDVTVGALIEPSYHLKMSDRLFAFVGAGVGFRYAKHPGVDLAIRPTIGMDILVGQSGILKPSLFLDIGTNDGVTQGGLQAGFTVML
jgi:hypothetical protein